MANPTATQKVTEALKQLNQALLQKDILAEQLEQANERVKALRNLAAGIELGQEMSKEQTQPVDNGSVD